MKSQAAAGHILGVDAGGSGTKWTLLRGDEVVARGRVAPLTSALLDTPAGSEALNELRAALPAMPDAVYAGLPGLAAGTDRAEAVAAQLAGGLGLSQPGLLQRQVWVESDLDLAYRAHLQPGEGILIYAGTGSIAYHVAASGAAARAGGRGYRIGDDGGGASLGRGVLRWATDALDIGQLPAGPLAAQMARITGGLDWDTLRAFVYGVPGASALARLAPAVTLAAEQGDGVALQLLEQAAQALATLGRRVQQQVGPLPLVATGGALQSQLLQGALRRQLPQVRLQFCDHAEAGARFLSRTMSHEP